jgi:hypothetical protein
MVVETANTGVMSLAEFQATREFLALTAKQRDWFTAYVETGDARLATERAYESKAPNLLTFQVQANARIVAALNRFFGVSPRDAFLKELSRTIQKESGMAKVHAQRLYAKLVFAAEESFDQASSKHDAEPSPKFAVGDICTQRGTKFRVTEVDSSGRPLAAEEVS